MDSELFDVAGGDDLGVGGGVAGGGGVLSGSGEVFVPVGDEAIFDSDGNGLNDLFVRQLADGSLVVVHDGNGDLVADTLGVDFNGDGVYEVVVVREGEGYRVFVDQDGDGVHDAEAVFSRADLLAIDPAVVTALDTQFGVFSGVGDPFPEQGGVPAGDDVGDSPYVSDGQLVGDPQGDSEHWFTQAVNGFCVPASVAQIVSEYTGVHFGDEQYFVERANELKVFEVGPDGVPGIAADGALALLEDAGIPASIEYGSGVETLVEYLEEGRRVILAVDSGELWSGEQGEDNAADHAIVVTGVDLQRGVVIVSDPGDPAGNAKEYPIDQFVDAWADSGYTAVVCDVTPEQFAGVEAEPVVAAQGGVQAGGLGVLEPGAAAGVESSAVSWAVQHSWAILPVLLGVGAGARLLADGISSST